MTDDPQPCLAIPCPEPEEFEIHSEWINPHEYLEDLGVLPTDDDVAPPTLSEVYASLSQPDLQDVVDRAALKAIHAVEDHEARNSVHGRFPKGKCPFCPFGIDILGGLGKNIRDAAKALA